MSMHTRVISLALILITASCARAYAPPGGDVDETPPQLVGTTPEPLAVVAPSREPAVFRFDNSLSERGFSEALVTVSPLDGAMRVDRSGSEVRVSIDGGWRADRVYRIVLLPGVRDRFNNVRNEPVELVFSTGPRITSTAIAGIVLDRITGVAAVSPVIDAVRRADSVRYVAIGDSTGFFALRHLPLGVYDMRAYADQNRNRRRDLLEPVDSGRALSLAAEDTLTQVFSVLAPDTSAPRVTGASALDSLHVRVVLDDHVTDDDAAAASARLFTLPDSTAFASGVEIMLERVHTALAGPPVRPAARSTPDSIAMDTLAVDSAAVVDPVEAARADSIAAALADAAAARTDSAVAAARELPAREIVVRLDRPLEPGTSYMIVITGVRNLHGLTGGGEARFETAEPPPPADAPPPSDTTSFRPPRPR